MTRSSKEMYCVLLQQHHGQICCRMVVISYLAVFVNTSVISEVNYFHKMCEYFEGFCFSCC